MDDLLALRWHIERYDRLRASTASRAGVAPTYEQFRAAARLLRWAAVIFLGVLALGVSINIIGRF